MNGAYYTSLTSIPDVPAYAQYTYTTGAMTTIYYVTMRNGNNFPQAIADMLFNNTVVNDSEFKDSEGRPQRTFFLGLDGWTWFVVNAASPYNTGFDMVVSLLNGTTDPINVSAKPKQGEIVAPSSSNGKPVFTVAPGEFGIVISHYSFGLETKIVLQDTSGSELAEFDLHQNTPANPDPQTWVGSYSAQPGYVLAEPATIDNESGVPGQVAAALYNAAS